MWSFIVYRTGQCQLDQHTVVDAVELEILSYDQSNPAFSLFLPQTPSNKQKVLCRWSETRWSCQCWTKRTLSICFPRICRVPCSCELVDWPYYPCPFPPSFVWLFSGICLNSLVMAVKAADSSRRVAIPRLCIFKRGGFIFRSFPQTSLIIRGGRRGSSRCPGMLPNSSACLDSKPRSFPNHVYEKCSWQQNGTNIMWETSKTYSSYQRCCHTAAGLELGKAYVSQQKRGLVARWWNHTVLLSVFRLGFFFLSPNI